MFHVFSPRGGAIGRLPLEIAAMSDADVASAVDGLRRGLGLEARETVIACHAETGAVIRLEANGTVHRVPQPGFSMKSGSDEKK